MPTVYSHSTKNTHTRTHDDDGDDKMSYSERQTLHNVIWISRCKYVCVFIKQHVHNIICIIYHYRVLSQLIRQTTVLEVRSNTNDWYGFHLKIEKWGCWGHVIVIWHLMMHYNISNRQSIRSNALRINVCTSTVRLLFVNISKQGLSRIIIISYIHSLAGLHGAHNICVVTICRVFTEVDLIIGTTVKIYLPVRSRSFVADKP